MEVKAISHSYWRSIKRGARTFKSIVESPKESVSALAGDIRTLAKAEVSEGIITEEQYKDYLGEDYPVGE